MPASSSPFPGLSEANLDLAKLNQFIYRLNQPVQVETMKADLAQARPFLERRCFIKDGAVTVLGALVCAQHPAIVWFQKPMCMDTLMFQPDLTRTRLNRKWSRINRISWTTSCS